MKDFNSLDNALQVYVNISKVRGSKYIDGTFAFKFLLSKFLLWW